MKTSPEQFNSFSCGEIKTRYPLPHIATVFIIQNQHCDYANNNVIKNATKAKSKIMKPLNIVNEYKTP